MGSRLRIVFMGSPDFAVPTLRQVAQQHDVVAVVTQPDKPRGRGRTLAPPPVKVAAQQLGIPVLQPEKLRRREVREEIASFEATLFVVAAYGKILSPRMLAVPPAGCLNVHASLLPAYRGAAPIQWAILNCERRTGITIMQMDAGMDTGPMLLQEAIEIGPEETAGTLHDRLAPLGGALMLRALAGLQDGSIRPTPQPAQGASLAPMLCKEDGLVDFTRPAAAVDCHIRGMDPWPGAHTFLDDRPLKLFRSRAIPGQSGAPGEVLCVDRRGLIIGCGEGAVCVRELQLPGRRCLFATEVVSGCRIPVGTRLGAAPAGS